MSIPVRIIAWAGLVGIVLVEVLVSSLRVAWEILTPRPRARPGILRVPLDVSSVGQITLLAHLVTLTPGTVSLDVSKDRTSLYVHAMFLEDPEDLVRRIKERLETRVRRVLP
jgi:multicomponent Na+:H+ antiporter subunit E